MGDSVTHTVVRALLRVAYSLLFRARAWHPERVPHSGGVVLVGNHASFLDPPLVGAPLPRPAYYMARGSLFDVPVFGSFIPRINAFPVDREGADLGAMRRSIRLLRAGGALVLFPEGTRTPDGVMRPFKPGFALLASRAGVPMVPAGVCGTFEAWPRGRALPRFGTPIAVAYGEPMDPPGKSKAACQAAAEEVQRRVQELHEELKTKR